MFVFAVENLRINWYTGVKRTKEKYGIIGETVC